MVIMVMTMFVFIVARSIFTVAWTMWVVAGGMIPMVVNTAAQKSGQHDSCEYCFHIIPLHRVLAGAAFCRGLTSTATYDRPLC